MNPQNVNPKNFDVESIVYTNPHEGFSIAIGIWSESGNRTVAMRWTGDVSNEEDKGYPKTFGNPMWFLLPDSLMKPLLKSIAGELGSDSDELIKILKSL